MNNRNPRPRTLRAGLPAFAYYYTVGSVGFWIPLYAKMLGWPYKEVTLLSTIYFLALTPMTFLTGFISDAIGRPNIVVALGMLGNAISTLFMPFTKSFSILALLRGVQAVSLATSLPIAIGALSTIYGPRKGVSIVAIFNGSGMVLGALIGAFLLPVIGFAPVFLSATLLSFVAFISMLKWELRVEAKGTKGVLKGLKRIPFKVLIAVFAIATRTFFSGGVFSILSVIFKKVLGLSVFATGIALATNPLFQAISTPFVSRAIAKREIYTYSLGIASTSIVFYLYVYSLGLPSKLKTLGIIGAQALLGVVYAFIMISGNTYIISRSPEEIRYTASSLFTLAFDAGWIVGTAVAGPYMDVHGPIAWVKLSVVGCIGAGLLALVAAFLERREA